MPDSSSLNPENLIGAIDDRTAEERAAADKRDEKRSRKIARMVLISLQEGITDAPVRTHRGPTFLEPIITRSQFEKVQMNLSVHDIEVDTYGRYLGMGDGEDRIMVTKVGDTPIEPSPYYKHELESRARIAARKAEE